MGRGARDDGATSVHEVMTPRSQLGNTGRRDTSDTRANIDQGDKVTVRRITVFAIAVLLAAGVAACGSSSSSSSQSASGSSSSGAPATINAAGSTLAAPIYQQWGTSLKSQGLTINYNPVGSGAGIADLETG